MEPIEDLERALDIAEAVMLKVTPEDLDRPTPCNEWTVRALANHMTGGCLLFGRAARGEEIRERPAPTDLIADDPAGAYRRAAQSAIEGWSTPGALDRTLVIPAGQLPGNLAIRIHMMDQMVHACDLARAIGHDVKLPDDLAETGLSFMHSLMTPERRGAGKPFGEEVSVAADAPVQQRLLAFSGRQP